MPAVLLVLLAALGAAGAWFLNRWQRQQRQREMQAAAGALGLQFAPHDALGLLDEPYEILSRGDGRGIESMAWGERDGVPVRLVDYWYYVNRQSGKSRTRSYTRLSLAMMGLDAHLPHVTITPEGLFGRLADAMGFRDIELESEEFNREFSVRSDDPKAASDVIDARMMEWLLAYGRGRSLELGGSFALTHVGRVSGPRLADLLGFLAEFRARVPRVVTSLYGPENPQQHDHDHGSTP